MQHRLNVNLVLCEDFDKENKTIYKMFNEITTDADHTATFTLLTFLNGIGDQENDSTFTLHYFLMEPESEGKKMGIYLGAIDFIKSNQNQANEIGDKKEGSTFADMRINKIPFLHSVEYRIEAYKVKECLDPNLGYDELRKKSVEYRKTGELVSVVRFDVKFPTK